MTNLGKFGTFLRSTFLGLLLVSQEFPSASAPTFHVRKGIVFDEQAIIPACESAKVPIIYSPVPHENGNRLARLQFELVDGKIKRVLPNKREDSAEEDWTSWRETARAATSALKQVGIDLGNLEEAFNMADQEIGERHAYPRSPKNIWTMRRLQFRLLGELFQAIAENHPETIEYLGYSTDGETKTIHLRYHTVQNGPAEAWLSFRQKGPPLLGIKIQTQNYHFEDVHLGSDRVKQQSGEIDIPHALAHWDFRDPTGLVTSWAGRIPAYPPTEKSVSAVEQQQDYLGQQLSKLEMRAAEAIGQNAQPVVVTNNPTLSAQDNSQLRKKMDIFKKKLGQAVYLHANPFRTVPDASMTHLILVVLSATHFGESDADETDIRAAIHHDLRAAESFLRPSTVDLLVQKLPSVIQETFTPDQQGSLKRFDTESSGRVFIIHNGGLNQPGDIPHQFYPQWDLAMQLIDRKNPPIVLVPYYGPTVLLTQAYAQMKGMSIQTFLSDEPKLRKWFEIEMKQRRDYEPVFGILPGHLFDQMRNRHRRHSFPEQLLVETYLLANRNNLKCIAVEPPFGLWKEILVAAINNQEVNNAIYADDVETFFKTGQASAEEIARVHRQIVTTLYLAANDIRRTGKNVLLIAPADYWPIVDRFQSENAKMTVISTANQDATPYSHRLNNRPKRKAQSNDEYELQLLRSVIALHYKRVFYEEPDFDQYRRAKLLTDLWDREDIIRLIHANARLWQNVNFWEPIARLSLSVFLRKAAQSFGAHRSRDYFENIALRLDLPALRRFEHFQKTFSLPATSEEAARLVMQWLSEDGEIENRTWITSYEIKVIKNENIFVRAVDTLIESFLTPKPQLPTQPLIGQASA